MMTKRRAPVRGPRYRDALTLTAGHRATGSANVGTLTSRSARIVALLAIICFLSNNPKGHNTLRQLAIEVEVLPHLQILDEPKSLEDGFDAEVPRIVGRSQF